MATHKLKKEESVADFVIQYPQLRPKLEQWGIDYCCGGKRPLAEAVSAAGKTWLAVEAELLKTMNQVQTDLTDWNRASLVQLVDHIVDTHHAFMYAQLPRLDNLLDKVLTAHGEHHGDMLSRLQNEYHKIRVELEAHLMKEEQVLFPMIKAYELYLIQGAEKPISHCGSVQNPIRQMEVEHDDAGEELVVIRQLTNDYTPPADACQTFKALFEGLEAMEADLHEHIHLENNILFPKSIAREEEANTKETGS